MGMSILVTGGAGYVGSVVVELLLREGHTVIVVDNLKQGHRKAVLPSAAFAKIDLWDKESLNKLFRENKIEAVMHMAAETVVEYSMTDPSRYFENNIVAGLNLLNCMLANGADKFIFSSTAAVYGEPVSESINEEHPKIPINSYGESKLIFETILKWYGKAYKMKHVSFRYFCAAGATGLLGEDHRPETHLLPNVLKAALDNSHKLQVFGNDYPTHDGTCIRDFVHIADIASAHVQALRKIDALSGNAYNLGNSQGYSVLDVIKAAEQVTGRKIKYSISPRRTGDPITLIATADKARRELDWQPQYSSLQTMLASAWEWMKSHPDGYDS